jgi:hypothetical protein
LAGEHPHHSNMDVFVVTHSPRIVDGQRQVQTDVWRVVSEAKAGHIFHNKALDMITEYYKEKLPGLQGLYLFTDGCRAQCKGRCGACALRPCYSQTSHWLMLTSHCLMLTSHWLVLTSHWLMLTSHWLMLTSHWLQEELLRHLTVHVQAWPGADPHLCSVRSLQGAS